MRMCRHELQGSSTSMQGHVCPHMARAVHYNITRLQASIHRHAHPNPAINGSAPNSTPGPSMCQGAGVSPHAHQGCLCKICCNRPWQLSVHRHMAACAGKLGPMCGCTHPRQSLQAACLHAGRSTTSSSSRGCAYGATQICNRATQVCGTKYATQHKYATQSCGKLTLYVCCHNHNFFSKPASNPNKQ